MDGKPQRPGWDLHLHSITTSSIETARHARVVCDVITHLVYNNTVGFCRIFTNVSHTQLVHPKDTQNVTSLSPTSNLQYVTDPSAMSRKLQSTKMVSDAVGTGKNLQLDPYTEQFE